MEQRSDRNRPVQPGGTLPPRRTPMPTYRKPVSDSESVVQRPVGYEVRQQLEQEQDYRVQRVVPSEYGGINGYARVVDRSAEHLADDGYPRQQPTRPSVANSMPVQPMGQAASARYGMPSMPTGKNAVPQQPNGQATSTRYDAPPVYTGKNAVPQQSEQPIPPRVSAQINPQHAFEPKAPYTPKSSAEAQTSQRLPRTGAAMSASREAQYQAELKAAGIPDPHPPIPDPFDEPGVDPELAKGRSEKLYSREDRFWENPEESKVHTDKPAAHAGGHVIRNVLLLVLVVFAVGLVLRGAVFRVHTINVEGNSTMTDDEVIALSGIDLGDGILEIKEDTVRTGLESNRYLTFVSFKTDLPDSVTIVVKERKEAAYFNYCGINYFVDSQGMVLEESEDTDAGYTDFPEVRGLSIRVCRIGRKLELTYSSQMTVFQEVLLELRVLAATDEVAELNLSDTENLYLTTRDGYAVRLGDSTDLHAKLRSMLLTRDKLNEMGYAEGTIDVSAPVNPTYIPENE